MVKISRNPFKTKSEKLMMAATELGACEKGLRGWGKDDSDIALIERYLRHIDFCIAHDYPSVSYIKKNFDKGLLHRYGIWCDEEVKTKNDMVLINGNCFGKLKFKDFDVATVYLRHQSKLTVNVVGFARIMVHCYERCELTINNCGNNTCFVYRHSPKVKINAFGDVIIRNKEEDKK